MNGLSFEAGRRRSAHDHHDHFSCDTVPPNHQAHRRGFIALLLLCAVAGAVALIGTTLQGITDMGGAFTSPSSLLDAGAWDKFFAGFGRVATLLLVVGFAVMLLRHNRRKAKKIAAAKK